MVEYKIIEGADQTIKSNTSIDLVIKINGDHELFDKLYIDGNVVEPKNYTITKGSTVVTLSANYLRTLSIGKHTVEAFYQDGKSVSTSLTVVKDENIEEIENIKNTGNTENTDDFGNTIDTDNSDNNKDIDNKNNNTENSNIANKSSVSPRTGDNIVIYIILLTISIVGAVIVLIINRRIKKKAK